MEYKIIKFAAAADGEAEMNALAKDGWRFKFMTDTPQWAYVIMERETRRRPEQT